MHRAPTTSYDLPVILLTEDVARELRASVPHARRLFASGEIPARRRGRRYYVLRDVFLSVLRPEGGPPPRHPRPRKRGGILRLTCGPGHIAAPAPPIPSESTDRQEVPLSPREEVR